MTNYDTTPAAQRVLTDSDSRERTSIDRAIEAGAVILSLAQPDVFITPPEFLAQVRANAGVDACTAEIAFIRLTDSGVMEYVAGKGVHPLVMDPNRSLHISASRRFEVGQPVVFNDKARSIIEWAEGEHPMVDHEVHTVLRYHGDSRELVVLDNEAIWAEGWLDTADADAAHSAGMNNTSDSLALAHAPGDLVVFTEQARSTKNWSGGKRGVDRRVRIVDEYVNTRTGDLRLDNGEVWNQCWLEAAPVTADPENGDFYSTGPSTREVIATIERGLAQSAAGDVVDLGDFSGDLDPRALVAATVFDTYGQGDRGRAERIAELVVSALEDAGHLAPATPAAG